MPDGEDEPAVYAVRLRAQARRDIEAEYARYIELVGEDVAQEWREKLLKTLARLSSIGAAMVLAPESKVFDILVHQLIYRRRPNAPAYRILYTAEIGTDGPVVRVLTIRHGSKDTMTGQEARDILEEDGGQ